MANGYCTTSEISYYLNTYEVTDLADDNADQTADTGVLSEMAIAASEEIWSYIYSRYSSVTAMDAGTYTAGSGVYPILETKAAQLAADMLRARQGVIEYPGPDHPVIKWCERVRACLADVV